MNVNSLSYDQLELIWKLRETGIRPKEIIEAFQFYDRLFGQQGTPKNNNSPNRQKQSANQFNSSRPWASPFINNIFQNSTVSEAIRSETDFRSQHDSSFTVTVAAATQPKRRRDEEHHSYSYDDNLRNFDDQTNSLDCSPSSVPPPPVPILEKISATTLDIPDRPMKTPRERKEMSLTEIENDPYYLNKVKFHDQDVQILVKEFYENQEDAADDIRRFIRTNNISQFHLSKFLNISDSKCSEFCSNIKKLQSKNAKHLLFYWYATMVKYHGVENDEFSYSTILKRIMLLKRSQNYKNKLKDEEYYIEMRKRRMEEASRLDFSGEGEVAKAIEGIYKLSEKGNAQSATDFAVEQEITL